MSESATATRATRQPTLDAVILAGGRAERLGGASKPDLVVAGRSLLETAIDAARSADCARIVVVGPPSLEAPGCIVVREDPPFGGPVAALAAGLAALATDAADPEASVPDAAPAPDVLVLACDMPAASVVVDRLLAGRRESSTSDGVCLVDASGREQWLAAIYSRQALARAFDALGHDTGGAAMRRLAASLDLTVLPDHGSTQDVDTWSDLERARSSSSSDSSETGGSTMTEPQTPEDLDRWVVEACELLGLDPADVPIATVLDLARRVAHGVARPAAPLTTFLLGLAVGSGRSEDLARLADRIGDLAESRGPADDAGAS